MNVSSLLSDMKDHARITHADEDFSIVLMLEAAAGDVAHAANYTLPADAAALPPDLRFAIIDQAAAAFDTRGSEKGMKGLTVAASRVVARYRGVSLGIEVTPDA